VQKGKKKFIWASSTRNGRFEMFFEKNGLSPLGVKRSSIEDLMQWILIHNVQLI
jgi:hypothetical protein